MRLYKNIYTEGDNFMDWKNYIAEWRARGIDYNYNGSISVYAIDDKSAADKAITIVSRKWVLTRNSLLLNL